MNREVEMNSFDDRQGEEGFSPVEDDEVEGVDTRRPSSPVDTGDNVSPMEDDAVSTVGVSPMEGDEPVDGDEGVPAEDKVIWDIVFPEGEAPLLVLALESDPEISSAAVLTKDDVDRLVLLSRKVEKHYSASSRLGRRIVDWAMRRKFFAGVTLALIAFIVINGIITGF